MAEDRTTKAEMQAEIAELRERLSNITTMYEDVMRNNQEYAADNDRLKGKLTHNVFVENGLRGRLSTAEAQAAACRAQVDSLTSVDDRIQLIYMVVHRGHVLSDGRVAVSPTQRGTITAFGDGSVESTRGTLTNASLPHTTLPLQ